MAAAKRSNVADDSSLKELRHIKMLLMLLLIKLGADSNELDFAVGMGAGNIRSMLPMKKIKKLTNN